MNRIYLHATELQILDSPLFLVVVIESKNKSKSFKILRVQKMFSRFYTNSHRFIQIFPRDNHSRRIASTV